MGKPAVVSAFVFALSASAWAQTGDPELKTDHPYYPGEAALSTPAQVVSHAMGISRGSLGNSTNRDKLIRLFLWRAEHYAHLDSPELFSLPGAVPNPHNAASTLLTDYDSMRAMFSYGWGVCGTNHAQMRAFAEELGWTDRRRGLIGDTGYEIFVDGGWRYVNTDQYTLHFLSNSGSDHFASLDQVISTNHHYAEWNPDAGLGYRLPQANTHGSYADFTTGVTGTVPNRSLQWRSYYNSVWKSDGNGNTPMYGEGYTATPVVYRLRRGETFTRWMQPGGIVSDLGLSGLIWFGYNGGDAGAGDNGPYAQWSFVQNAPARDETPGGSEESRGQQRYGNGCFDWTPNLSNGEHLDGAAAVTGSLVTGGSPLLKSSGTSTLILEHFTPYTIAGRPSDGLDPYKGAVDGAIVYGAAVGTVGVEVSINAGMTWTSVGTLSGTSQVDFTNSVLGRNQYLLRLSFDNGEGLNSLRLRTITMLSQAVYPTLKDTTTQVTYAAGNTGALELSPDLFTSSSANSTSGYVQKVADSGNLSGVFYNTSNPTYAYVSTNGNAVSLTYQITMPSRLASAGAVWKQIQAAQNTSVHVTPSGGPYGMIEVAAAATGPWTQIASYSPPADNQLSSFWTYGKSGSPLGGTTYFVRYTAYNGGFTTSIRYLRLFATYSLPAPAAPMEVTYEWNNGAAQTNTRTIAAGVTSDTWSISTGSNVVQKKVSIRVLSGGAPVDSDGDGMVDSFEIAHGFDPHNADEDGNGVLDGNDDWDHDGILNANDSSPGVKPTPVAPSGGGGGGGGGGCGLLGLEALVLWLFRRLRPLPSWRRKNGRRWVLQ